MGSFVFGYSLVLTTILGSTLAAGTKEGFSNSLDEKSLNEKIAMNLSVCTTALPLGGLVGSLIYSTVLRALRSERKSMIWCDLMVIFLYTLQMCSLNPIFVTFIRFCLGVAMGISCTVVPMYLISISPTKISGTIGSLNQILITHGIAVAYGMGFLIDEKDINCWWRWRICVLLPACICFLRLITLKIFKYDRLERHIE